MAMKTLDSTSESTPSKLTFDAASGDRIQLPSEGFITDATITRDGDDLVLQAPSGEIAVIKDYYSVEESPLLQSPNGTTLTPELVESFSTSSSQYAAGDTASDESPVGAAEEVKGGATVTRTDGTVEPITIGTPIYQGDTIQTEADGAVNIRFMDETSMAVSQNARMSIDNYNFDAKTESGETDFSVLRGVFVFTSGLIGRDDPDDVHITTPVGSIGIRGTIIAGDINPTGESSITVLEGAIVVTNSQSETTLSKQFETVHLQGFDTPMQEMGVVPAADINARFESVSYVVPTLFSTIQDSIQEEGKTDSSTTDVPVDAETKEEPVEQKMEQQDQEPSNTDTTVPVPEESLLPDQSRNEILDPLLSTKTDDTGLTRGMGLHVPVGETTVTSGTTTEGSVRTGQAPTTSYSNPGTRDDIGETPNYPIRPGATGGSAAFNFTLSNVSIASTAEAGHVVGSLTSNATLQTDVSYTFSGTGNSSSANGYFNIVGTNIVLTTVGALALKESLEPISLGTFGVNAVHTDGRTATHSYTSITTDTNVALDLNSGTASGVTVIHDTIYNHIGYSITALGDMNNDGFDDFGFTNDVAGQNHVYVVNGGAGYLGSASVTDLDAINRLDVEVFSGLNGSNTVLAGVGDYNGDHIRDYVIGQSDASFGMDATGSALIMSPNAGGSTNFTFGTAAIGSGFGSSVAGVGDFNNDGYADAVIGAPNYNAGGNTNAGRFMLMKGNVAWDDANLATGGTFATAMNGANANDYVGHSVAGVGDMNGDGYSDFAVGMPGANGGNGGVKIFYGSLGGSLTGTATINGMAADDWLGEEIRGLGDINGDGYSDMLIGSALDSAKIALGSASAPTVRNMNLTSFDYTIVGGGSAGDFNGDGYDDMTVALSDGTDTKIYVVYGGTAFNGFNSLNYLKNPENAFEMSYTGSGFNDLEISGIGDFNGDGYDDIAIGVPDANGSTVGDGGVIIVHGRNTGDSRDVLNATTTGQSIVGTNGSDNMVGGSFGDLSIRAGAGDDTININSTNFRRIDGGSGYDTLRFNIAGSSLDFSSMNFEDIQSIERLQFGANNQTMTLTVENLFNLLKSSDLGVLKINSDGLTGSILNIDATSITGSGWQDRTINAMNEMGSNTTNPATDVTGFTKFQIGGYNLYIDTDVTVNVV